MLGARSGADAARDSSGAKTGREIFVSRARAVEGSELCEVANRADADANQRGGWVSSGPTDAGRDRGRRVVFERERGVLRARRVLGDRAASRRHRRGLE